MMVDIISVYLDFLMLGLIRLVPFCLRGALGDETVFRSSNLLLCTGGGGAGFENWP